MLITNHAFRFSNKHKNRPNNHPGSSKRHFSLCCNDRFASILQWVESRPVVPLSRIGGKSFVDLIRLMRRYIDRVCFPLKFESERRRRKPMYAHLLFTLPCSRTSIKNASIFTRVCICFSLFTHKIGFGNGYT